MTFDLDLWPTDLNILRDHLLIKDYLHTKFEASGAKRSWVISCARLRDTDQQTCATQYAPPSLKGGGGGITRRICKILMVQKFWPRLKKCWPHTDGWTDKPKLKVPKFYSWGIVGRYIAIYLKLTKCTTRLTHAKPSGLYALLCFIGGLHTKLIM